MITITEDDAFELATLVYRRWAEEFDLLKAVKAEKPDAGDSDWQAFHDVRLKNHTAAEAKWRAIRDRLVTAMPKLGVAQ